MATAIADKGLDADELSEKYDKVGEWGEHPEHTLSDWKFAVINEDTRRGYWDWVACLIEEEDDEGQRPGTATLEGMKYSEGVAPESDGSLPPFDELQYIYYAPEMEHGDAEGDYYGVVGFKDGKGRFSGLVPSGRLEKLVGPTLANKMVLGQGDVVRTPDVTHEVNPYRSLQIHGKEFTQMDAKWLAEMGIH